MKIKACPIPQKIALLASAILSCFCITSSNAAVNNIHTKQDRYISYTEIGQGEPLVLIHAFPTDQQLWVPQQEGLKQYFRVITLDLWGFGPSGGTDGQAVAMTDYGSFEFT